MFRTIARTSLMAGIIGLSALGTAAVANAAPDTNVKAYGNVCYGYDYSTQVFYDCH